MEAIAQSIALVSCLLAIYAISLRLYRRRGDPKRATALEVTVSVVSAVASSVLAFGGWASDAPGPVPPSHTPSEQTSPRRASLPAPSGGPTYYVVWKL